MSSTGVITNLHAKIGKTVLERGARGCTTSQRWKDDLGRTKANSGRYTKARAFIRVACKRHDVKGMSHRHHFFIFFLFSIHICFPYFIHCNTISYL